MTQNTAQKNIHIIYVVGFILSLSSALPAYVSSTYLSQFTSENLVGFIYAISSALSIAIFAFTPVILSKIGNTKSALIGIFLGFISFLALCFAGLKLFIPLFFIANTAALIFVFFNFDVFLEHLSKNSVTGGIRGVYLVCGNAAWIVAQLFTSIFISSGDYWKIFLASGLCLLPIYLIVFKYFRKFEDPRYVKIPFWKSTLRIFHNKDVAEIYSINFLLQFFYCWMVIYIPMYLFNHVGFGWPELSVMFGIMLLPFVIFEAPLGWIADRFFGEKEILFIGFILMSAACAIITFISSNNFFLWTAILFLSRVGASMVEVMSETYFFKKVRDIDVNIISTFRTTRPWAYVFAPIVATLALLLIDFKFLFLILAAIMLIGAWQSAMLKDTK